MNICVRGLYKDVGGPLPAVVISLLAFALIVPFCVWKKDKILSGFRIEKAGLTYQSNFQILGSEKFQRQVYMALALLHEKDLEDYLVVEKYLRRVVEAHHSGTQVAEIPPTFYFAPKSAFRSLTWCASDLVHEAYHCKLYRDYLENHGTEVPQEIYSGEKAETQCIKRQLGVLEKVGASTLERFWLNWQDARYYTVPYSNRSW
jgi:hypothetical protein